MSAVKPASFPPVVVLPETKRESSYSVVLLKTAVGCAADVSVSTPFMFTQTQMVEGIWKTPRSALRAILKGEVKPRKIYNGAWANYLSYAPNLSLAMTWKDALERSERWPKTLSSTQKELMAANIAGAAASALFVGMERIMLQQQVLTRGDKVVGFWQAAKDIFQFDKTFRQQQFPKLPAKLLTITTLHRSLTLGMMPMLARDCGFISMFPLSHALKKQLPESLSKDHPFLAHLAVAIPIGWAGAVITMPFVNIKTRMQVCGMTFSQAFTSVAEQGSKGFLNGWQARGLSLTSGVAFVWLGSELSEKPLLWIHDQFKR